MRRTRNGPRDGVTLVEMLVVVAIVAILIGLLLPAIQRVRETSRKTQCSVKLKHLGLAHQGFVDMRGYFVFADGTTNAGTRGTTPIGNEGTINGLVYLIDFLEETANWQVLFRTSTVPATVDGQAVNGYFRPGTAVAAYGPPRDFLYYQPWRQSLQVMLCPSSPPGDPYLDASIPMPTPNRRNYFLCYGDKIYNNHATLNTRGVFGFQSRTKYKDITDGTSKTILMSEVASNKDATDIHGLGAQGRSGMNSNPASCLATASAGRYVVPVQTSRPLTSLWHSSLIAFVGFNTVLPPNSPTCLADTYGDSWALASASSYHDRGVNVLMADGSVRFITDNVDTGNLSAAEVTTGQSPYGVWGALGTLASGESRDTAD